MKKAMRITPARTGKSLLDGAMRIIVPSRMEKTWSSLEQGSIVSDWQAVGDDLRRLIKHKGDRPIG